MQIAETPLHISTPNGDIMQSTHTGLLDLPNLSTEARKTHVVPELHTDALISVGKCCDDDCSVIFDKASISIKKDNQLLYSRKKAQIDFGDYQFKPAKLTH